MIDGNKLVMEDYHNFIRRVIEWNRAAGNENFTSEQIEQQKKLCFEEIQETMEALEKDLEEDINIEVFDGIADIFVVGVYLNYLQSSGEYQDAFCPSNTLIDIGYYTDVFNIDSKYSGKEKIKDDLYTSLYLGRELLDWNNVLPDVLIRHFVALGVIIMDTQTDIVRNILNEVLLSNESKFLTIQQHRQKGNEILQKANEQYNGQHEDIVYEPIWWGQRPMYVLKSNHGKGKILKPYTYFKPDIKSVIERSI